MSAVSTSLSIRVQCKIFSRAFLVAHEETVTAFKKKSEVQRTKHKYSFYNTQ